MANLSDLTIEVTDGNYMELMNEIRKNSEDLGGDTYDYTSPVEEDEGRGFTVDYTRVEQSKILFISGEGRWYAATNYIQSLFSELKLTGTIVDTEAGANFFILKEYENGILVKDIDDEYFCEESVEYTDDSGFWYDNYEEYLKKCIDNKEDEIFVQEFCRLLKTTKEEIISCLSLEVA